MGRFTLAAAAVLLATVVSNGHAFTVKVPSTALRTATASTVSSFRPAANVRLSMAEQQEPEATEEETNEKEKESEEEESEEEEEEEQEDPEMVALKQEIQNLESTLKARERDLAYQKEKLEEYSKGGYARKVAEMETMRRARSMMNSSSREVAVASVLQNFLPVLDSFEELEEKYGSDDFGKSFSALGGTMRAALKELGVEEYSVKEGEKVNKQRVTVIEEEYSNDFEKDTIIRPIAMGMELQGNVMRMAECVASLGSESAKEEEAEEEETKEEDADEDADEKESSEEETPKEE